MRPHRSLIAAAIALCSAAPVHADIFTTTGTTAGAPTFNRPLEDLSGLSNVGIDTNYSAFTFSVDAGGEYSFLTTAGFDSFVVLYSDSFNPAAPLANALIANDDLVSFTTSGFAWNLAASTNYTYVVTSFSDGDAGGFSTTIGGPGAISPIPEPASLAMMIAGLGLLAAARRRGI